MKKLTFLGLLFTLLLAGCTKPANIVNISKNLSTYDMAIVYNDEEKTLQVEQVFDFKNPTDTMLEDVMFHLYPQAFAQGAVNKPVGVMSKAHAYPHGESYGGIEISTATLNNDTANYQLLGVDKDILKIPLPHTLAPDASASIVLTYIVTLPNIHHRFGYCDNTINVANFYPVVAMYENGWICDPYHYNGDPFYTDMANYNVQITTPAQFTLATTGEILHKSLDGNLATYNIKALAVRDYAFVMSEKFEVIEAVHNKTKVMYYHYDDTQAQYYLQTAVDALKTFNSLFGIYPYSTLSVVKTNFVHGGMEYANLVYISDAVTDQESYANVIVHEIAHQWWYGLVGSNAFRFPWLDEGLTEYSTLLFYEHNPSYDISPKEIIKNTTENYVAFLDFAKAVVGNVDTSMNRWLDQYPNEPEYVYITYIKGMLFFDALRNVVGDKAFMKAVKNYFETNKFKNVNPSHLLDAFERASRQKLDGFFDSWIDGKVSVIKI